MQRVNRSCLLAAVILSPGCGPGSEAPSGDTESESHSPFLYVWAGAEEDSGSDFLAVINADPESAGYGQVVASVPVGVKGGAHHSEHVVRANDSLFVNSFTAG